MANLVSLLIGPSQTDNALLVYLKLPESPIVKYANQLALDAKNGSIYCRECGDDPIISDTFDHIQHLFLVEAEEEHDDSRDLKGRTRGRWKAWSPGPEERKGLIRDFSKSSCRGMLTSQLFVWLNVN
jgi:hypothetical protein